MIIISQRIDYDSEYDDEPFQKYHYPKRYRNLIKTGDLFIYYQGDRHKRENRYYYGTGIVGDITMSKDGEYYFADILYGLKFPNNVPIYNSIGGYYESIGYDLVRKKINPPWQSAIRKLSSSSFKEIIKSSGLDYEYVMETFSSNNTLLSKEEQTLIKELFNYTNEQSVEVLLETATDEEVNQFLSNLNSNASIELKKTLQKIRKASNKTIESLKQLYGYSCQICGVEHNSFFGVNVVEAHHIEYFSQSQNHRPTNIVILCPTHHRLIHTGKAKFEKQRKAFVYENGYEEILKNNRHL
jgi:predicted HNH restriction endonuclease